MHSKTNGRVGKELTRVFCCGRPGLGIQGHLGAPQSSSASCCCQQCVISCMSVEAICSSLRPTENLDYRGGAAS
jgi:hypothetical protein